ncbi:MAG: GNAT family N-acetyltransferase [Jatrophihabitans sp.]
MKLGSLGYRTDLALLRLGGTEVEDRGDHLVVRSPHNPSHWWGNFLLLDRVPTPESSEAWLDRFAATIPHAEHVALGFDGTDGSVHDLGWFAGRGFNAEAQTVMTATRVHEPAHPNTHAVYRPLHSAADWAQSVELRVRCNDQRLEPLAYRRFVTAKSRTNRRLVDAGHGTWFGAFLEGQLVAQMGLFSASPGLARFQSVETAPNHRRRGLAGSLVHHVSRFGFDKLGARTLVMVADPTYFAIDLYQAVGFTAAETQLQIETPATR